MQVSAFLNELRQNGTLMAIATDPRTQFGTKSRRYLGAEILPERPVNVNDYIEESIRYRTIVANSGTRYSPSQKKGGGLVGSFPVHLAHSDIGSELTSQDYDAFVTLLRGAGAYVGSLDQNAVTMQAMAQVTNWLDTTVVLGLVELLEVMRWQAIIHQLVNLTGDNGYSDTVKYPSYPDLHSAAGGTWSNDTYDPYADLTNKVLALSARGISPARIIIGTQALNKFLQNALVRTRTGHAVMSPTGQLKGTAGIATVAQINSVLEADGMPPFEKYDLMYRTEVGAKYFFDRDCCVIIGASGRNENVDLGDAQYETIENVIGYTAMGRGVGQATPGRYVRTEQFENKPPRIEAEGWQTALPVITEPEAFAVISGIQ